MANYEATRYDFDGAAITGIQGFSTGTIVPWSDTTAPSGFLECTGAAVARSAYAALFAVIGTTYGSGNGSTTFNLPDLKNDVPLGKSNTKALASTGGANTVSSTGNIAGSTAAHTLTTPEMSPHSHPTIKPSGAYLCCGSQSGRLANPTNTGSAGGGGGHSHNMSANFSGDATAVVQPYIALMYIIKI